MTSWFQMHRLCVSAIDEMSRTNEYCRVVEFLGGSFYPFHGVLVRLVVLYRSSRPSLCFTVRSSFRA